ncbi:MAG: hypothetical protein AMS27_03790 [Bacteroides sp. SM23_62_1]|nr:MAG: hypothetical protein AMS27_03790 [Bacteroides sp. SM23_62_1]
MNEKFIIKIIIIISLFYGCKAKESIIKKEVKANLDITRLEKSLLQNTEGIKAIKLEKVTLAVQLKNELHQLNGTIGIIKDSVIVISLVPLLGYEIARVYCTIDSVFIIDRQNKTIYYSKINEHLGDDNIRIDYTILQAILMNQVVLYDMYDIDEETVKNVRKEGDYYYYTIDHYKGNNIYSREIYKIKTDNLQNEYLMVIDYSSNRRLITNYKEFKSIKQYDYPMEIEMIITDTKDSIQIKLNVGDIEINGKINAGINLPDNYNLIPI